MQEFMLFCLHFEQVYDKDIGQDKQLGIAKLPLIDLQGEVNKEVELRLLASLNTLKVKDKKDRGTLTIKVGSLLQQRWIPLTISIVCTYFVLPWPIIKNNFNS